MTIGFVGIGDQGEPIVHRMLGAGFPVRIYARQPARARALRQSGAELVASVSELASSSEILGR